MKIAHVVCTFPPYWSGTGLVAFNLVSALDKRGVDVRVITPKTKENIRYAYGSIKVHLQNTWLRFGQAPLTPDILTLKDIDLIHLHYPYYFGTELVALKSLFGKIPYVVTYHNDVVYPGLAGKLVNLHTKYAAPFTLKGAARFCVPTESFAQTSSLVKRLNNLTQVEVVPHGIDTQRFNPAIAPVDVHAKYDIPADKTLVLFVRTLDKAHYHSGLEVLLEAMRLVHDQGYLLVVGEGELRPTYEKSTKKLGIDKQVRFAGVVGNDMLPGYYTSADIFVLPSLITESFGLVALEALACGTPVVASDVGGIRDVVKDKKEGILVHPGRPEALAEAINYLIEHKSTAVEFGMSGSRRVMDVISWDAIAAQYENMYSSVL